MGSLYCSAEDFRRQWEGVEKFRSPGGGGFGDFYRRRIGRPLWGRGSRRRRSAACERIFFSNQKNIPSRFPRKIVRGDGVVTSSISLAAAQRAPAHSFRCSSFSHRKTLRWEPCISPLTTPLKRPKERPAGLSFGNLLGGWTGGRGLRGTLGRGTGVRGGVRGVIQGFSPCGGRGWGGRGSFGAGIRRARALQGTGAARRGRRALRVGAEGPINHLGQPGHSEALAAAGARDGVGIGAETIKKGGLPPRVPGERLAKRGRLRAPPAAEKASKKEWQRSKFCER